jgi:hypothetical protein
VRRARFDPLQPQGLWYVNNQNLHFKAIGTILGFPALEEITPKAPKHAF